jgi:trehalose/maltose hydrolase-like predicted phosphorylase
MRFASQIGLASLPQAEAYCRLASGFYHSRALRHPGGSFSIVDTLSPDENAHVEHDSYTNLAADLVTRWAGAPLGKPHLPRQGRALLNYSGDRGGRLNQHALLLAVWPWEHPAAVARAPEILASCRGRANPDGPAMSLSIEALAEARYGDPDRALATWREAFRRYEHGPQLLMGETRNRPAGVFRTGVAGCWSAVLYGFLGVHVGEQPTPGSLWQRRLESGAWVSVRPRLPSAWKRVDFRIVLDGVPVRLSASRTGVAAVQGPVVQAEGTRFRR